MKFKPFYSSEDEDDNNDFFDSPAEIPEKVKEPKKPRLSPDNPDYWDQEESEFAHILPHHPKRRLIWVWLGGAILLIALLIGFKIRYISPYITEASTTGYLEHIEYRGNIFKTYEGVLLPYKELHDTTRIYRRDFIFSVSDKQLAYLLRDSLKEGQPVRLTYDVYHATLPWRGASKIVVTGVDSVDPRTILPPDLLPEEERR